MPRLHLLGIKPILFLSSVTLVTWVVFLIVIPHKQDIYRFLSTHSHKAVQKLHQQHPFRTFDKGEWLYQAPKYPTKFDDLGFIIRTSYATIDRIPTQLDSLGLDTIEAGGNLLVISDFADNLNTTSKEILVHDAIADAIAQNAFEGEESAPHLEKYMKLAKAIEDGKHDLADELARSGGGELDALKFIPGLDMAWRKMPDKKWYLMMDDDTYMVKESLERFLGQLNPAKPSYLGNALGTHDKHSSYGGSAFLLSQEAMRRLFNGEPKNAQEAYRKGLNERWDDRIISETLRIASIHLNDWDDRLFRGERPETSRMDDKYYCSPLIFFHGLRAAAQMAEAAARFGKLETPLVWSQLWNMYRMPSVETFEQEPVQWGFDHVGSLDESCTTQDDITSARQCYDICMDKSDICLAWMWERADQACHICPWVIMGEGPRKYSGINSLRIKDLSAQCRNQAALAAPEPADEHQDDENGKEGIDKADKVKEKV